MKELILFVLKPLSFLPALAIMYIIYSFSGQTGAESGNLSYEVSVKIVEIGNQVLDKGLDEWGIQEVAARIEYPVRKIAHMTEYFILAVAVSFPFYVYGLRGFPLMVVAGMICVGFAAGDEYHQSFVDGRGPSVVDVGIDSIGSFFGILTVRIVCFIFLTPARIMERRRRRERKKAAKRARTGRAQRVSRSHSSSRPRPSRSYRCEDDYDTYKNDRYDYDSYGDEYDDGYDYDSRDEYDDGYDYDSYGDEYDDGYDYDSRNSYRRKRTGDRRPAYSREKVSAYSHRKESAYAPYSREQAQRQAAVSRLAQSRTQAARTHQNTRVVRPPQNVKPDTASFHTISMTGAFMNDTFEEQLGREIQRFTDEP